MENGLISGASVDPSSMTRPSKTLLVSSLRATLDAELYFKSRAVWSPKKALIIMANISITLENKVVKGTVKVGYGAVKNKIPVPTPK